MSRDSGFDDGSSYSAGGGGQSNGVRVGRSGGSDGRGGKLAAARSVTAKEGERKGVKMTSRELPLLLICSGSIAFDYLSQEREHRLPRQQRQQQEQQQQQ